MSVLFHGDICLSDIPHGGIRRVRLRDGRVKSYLRVFVGERRSPTCLGGMFYTHYISCYGGGSSSSLRSKRGRTSKPHYLNVYIGNLQVYDNVRVVEASSCCLSDVDSEVSSSASLLSGDAEVVDSPLESSVSVASNAEFSLVKSKKRSKFRHEDIYSDYELPF